MNGSVVENIASLRYTVFASRCERQRLLVGALVRAGCMYGVWVGAVRRMGHGIQIYFHCKRRGGKHGTIPKGQRDGPEDEICA